MTPEQFKHAELDYLNRLSQRLNAAKHGQKGKLVTESATFLNISKAELYRRLEAIGYSTGRKSRSDKGTSKVSAQNAQLIGGMVYDATRKNGKRTTPIKLALELGIKSGAVPKVSQSTIARVMKQHHCHPSMLETPSPHIEQRSLHPNHVWQVDASVCILFYLPRKKDGLQALHIKEYNKNKLHNLQKIEKDLITRYVITDHYSGSIYCEYVRGTESAANLINVLLNAMQKRGTKTPMHGVPNIIYTDKGSAMTSGLFTNLLARLDIRIIDHKAGNPRAKGQVENSQNIVETQFEGSLEWTDDPVVSLEQINDLVSQWLAYYNYSQIHSRHGKTRNTVWLTIKPEQLRIAPSLDVCQELVTTKPERRVVAGNLTISFASRMTGNANYRLNHVEGIYPNAEVFVVVNPYRIPDIDVHFAGKVHTVSPVKMDENGIFAIDATVIGEAMASVKATPVDKARQAVKRMAYNAKTDAELEQAVKAKQAPYTHIIDNMANVKSVEVPDYIPRAGTVLDIPTQRRELAPLSHVEAAKAIKGCVGDLWTPAHYAELTAQYPNTVPAEAIDSIVTRIKGGQSINHLKVVNG